MIPMSLLFQSKTFHLWNENSWSVVGYREKWNGWALIVSTIEVKNQKRLKNKSYFKLIGVYSKTSVACIRLVQMDLVHLWLDRLYQIRQEETAYNVEK